MLIICIILLNLVLINSFIIPKFINSPLKFQLLAKGFGTSTSRNELGLLEGLKRTKSHEHLTLRGTYGKLIGRMLESFASLKNDKNIQTTYDLYARMSNSDTFWFVGKINHLPEINSNEALVVLTPLLIEYSKTLRPLELAGANALQNNNNNNDQDTNTPTTTTNNGNNGKDNGIQIWTAPGNSEMDCVQHKVTLDYTRYSSHSEKYIEDLNDKFTRIMSSSNNMHIIGFEPEIYQGGEDGFRIKRDDDGRPIRAVVNVNVKTPEEMEQENMNN